MSDELLDLAFTEPPCDPICDDIEEIKELGGAWCETWDNGGGQGVLLDGGGLAVSREQSFEFGWTHLLLIGLVVVAFRVWRDSRKAPRPEGTER